MRANRATTWKAFSGELLPLAVVFCVWLTFFFRMILGETVCGFRDSAYLYYPLFQWIDSVWASGQVPLWNPYDGFGTPLLADGSSSVFYPGKIVFLARFLTFESRYGLYLSVHVLWAAVGCYWLSRALRLGPVAAGIAALAYAFGGPVVVQVSNVVYLVGAAWLPFALASGIAMVRKSSFRWAIICGGCCAMMILGGDPQMVYHIGLILAALLLGKTFWVVRRFKALTNFVEKPVLDLVFADCARLVLVVVVTVLLSAVQLFPTMEWAAQSERNLFEYPRTVYEIGQFQARQADLTSPVSLEGGEIGRGIFGDGQPGSHHSDLYEFSLPPWSGYELFWPNLSGRMFPVHQRWVDGLPGAERVWFPSLYLGGFVALFALGSFRLWGHRKRQVLLSRIGLFFGLAALGWYGLPWLAREVVGAESVLEGIGSPVGGLYWAMVVLLPKYVVFRYPAKLFIVASLMICVLGGVTFDRILSCRMSGVNRRWLFSLCVILAVVSIVIGGLSQTSWAISLFEGLATRNEFGPLDIRGALWQVGFSGIHAALMFGAAALLLGLRGRVGGGTERKRSGIAEEDGCSKGSFAWLPVAWLVLLAIDLTVANRWLIAEVDSGRFTSAVPFSEKIVFSSASRHQLPVVVHQTGWAGLKVCETNSSERLGEWVSLYRSTLTPKFHLVEAVIRRDSFSSIQSVRQVVPTGPRVAFQPEIEKVQWRGIENGFFARHWGAFAEAERYDANAEVRSRFFVVDEFRTNGLQVVSDSSPEQGWFCLQEQWDAGWRATLIREDGMREGLDIERWRGRFRAVAVPAGSWTLEMVYWPGSFVGGAWVSSLAWLCLAGWLVWEVRAGVGGLKHRGTEDTEKTEEKM